MQQPLLPHRSQSQSSPSLSYARHSPMRFVLLLTVILVAFANEYSFNNPQALEDSLETVLGINEAQFQLFYSLYALPNIFTLLFIGYLCDLFGMRLSLVILSALIALFQLVIAIGGYMESFGTILAGRILFGVVSEALFIPQASLVAFWFQGKEQALAMGVVVTFPELGNALNSYLTPIIFDDTQNLGTPLMFSFGLCLVGFACALIAFFLDRRADKIDEVNNVEKMEEEQDTQQIRLSDVKKLRKAFWIAAAICTSGMNLWIPFLDNVNKLFQVRFCFTQISAGKAVALVYLTSVAASIPLGMYVDHYGQRRVLTIIGLVIFLIAQAIFLLYPQCQNGGDSELGAISGLIFEGLGYSFYANVFVASIPLVTKAKILGTAFGIMEMLESFFEFLVPLLTGQIVSSASSDSLGYRYSSIFFISLGVVGLGIGALLFLWISEHNKHKLDRSSLQNELVLKLREKRPQLVSQSSTSTVMQDENRDASKITTETVDKKSAQVNGEEGEGFKALFSSFELTL